MCIAGRDCILKRTEGGITVTQPKNGEATVVSIEQSNAKEYWGQKKRENKLT